uniref:Glycoprotein Xg n=1 Tax=Gongylonema pulchrum TaxID=637853 RepID=A0A183EZQ0_9BILA
LNIPPPSSPPPATATTSTEMRGPPPKRHPPIPPLLEDEMSGTAHASATDDSQYEEPGMPSSPKRFYDGWLY